jgi:hypothetical protein
MALSDSGLPKYLWAEAFNAVTYVHNRTPTRALGGRTPYEVVHGVKPDVSHLRAFGAPCAIVGLNETPESGPLRPLSEIVVSDNGHRVFITEDEYPTRGVCFSHWKQRAHKQRGLCCG